jgi:hypothetical protein
LDLDPDGRLGEHDRMANDGEYSRDEQKWLAVWDARVQAVADGQMTPEDVYVATWREKVLNAISVTLQRMKRAEQPGRDSRRDDSTWVTVVAERGRRKEDLSFLAFNTFAYVFQKLKERGHDFHVDWMATANGVIVISIHVRSLGQFLQQRAGDAGAPE